ncbi:histidine kinase [Reichenbachiella carrageenanivorans]|uniref:Histidine kinase n=1 Tax=Reichenbachiella carrageenanivorans TaxID=2979869 RepID=A0ABY6D031_9BACT|nr:histidine kinase [Reichenbachiella carrageenanivorans]UXX78418.1 histidine kinase [Reichenbachiella carrageenanivorans]
MISVKTITIVIILALSHVTFSQEKEKEKVRYKSLSERSIDTDQSAIDLLETAEGMISTDPARALDLIEQALATSITQQSVFHEAKCYLLLAEINENQSEMALANQNYLEAYQRLFKGYGKTMDFEETLEGLGRVNEALGNYGQAVQFYERLLGLTTDENKRLEIELKLAAIEIKQNESQMALKRMSELEPSATYHQSKSLQSKGRAIKARAYAQQENYEAAEESLAPAPELITEGLHESMDDMQVPILEDEEAEELLNIYSQQNRQADEIALREKIAASKTEANLPLQAAKQRQAIGKVLIEQGRTQDAINQLKQAVILADSTGHREEQASAYLALAEAYTRTGESELALAAYARHSQAMEDWMEEQRSQRSFRETLLKKQQDIQALTKDMALDESSYLLEETTSELQAQQLKGQRLLIYGLSMLLLFVMLGAFFVYRKALQTKRVGQLLALKSLRAQMNPHFIFNALNSVNQFVALNDERAANKFLADFSKLMRMVLDNSQKEFISLREEQDMIALYLKLEHYRFRDQFEYEFVVDPELDLDDIEIPPMLLQPHIENAIWHGLRYKKEKGHLRVNIYQNGSGIKISIEDDGIGRTESARSKTVNQKKKNSVGLKNTQERISIINEVYRTHYAIVVSDLNDDGTGTRVEILTPTYHG